MIKDKPHPQFKREGADIRHIVKLSLRDALCGTTIQVPTLEKVTVPMPLAEIVKPSTVKRLPNQGLPLPKQPNRRGDIIVAFDIKFPENLTKESREVLKDILPPI